MQHFKRATQDEDTKRGLNCREWHRRNNLNKSLDTQKLGATHQFSHPGLILQEMKTLIA